MIKRLEQSGWAGRITDPEDGRAWLVSITEAGRARLAELRADTAQLIRERLSDDRTPVSSDELRSAIDVITRLTASLVGTSDSHQRKARSE
jgi:DNA-binding MarR family transcriptional regulator